jgi:perosamine synthetase
MAQKNTMQMSGPSVTKEDTEIVMDALQNGWYGEKAYYYVEAFEREIADYHNRKYALMTTNCTSALHLLLDGLGIGEGDEVIAPECTWIGSVACITYQRAKTVFADIDPINWCLTADSIEAAISPKTKAVIVVDLYGNMPDYDAIKKVCDKHNILMIEDSAESLGSIYKGVKAGKFGVGSVFSFHRTKTITTGEGGMLLIDDEELFQRCKFLRDHGRQPGSFFNTEITFKYMPFNVQAALGYAQFKRINQLVEKKRWILKSYKERLSDIPDIQMNSEPEHIINGAWATALVFGSSHRISRDNAIEELTKLDLPVRPFFYPLSSLPAFNDERNGRTNNPVAYDISSRGINLPYALNLTEFDLDKYTKALRSLLKYS